MPNRTATYLGIGAAVLMMAIQLIAFYLFHMQANGNQQWLMLVVFCIAIMVSLWLLASRQQGRPEFKELFQQGFKTFIAAAFIMVVFTFVFYKLNPQILDLQVADNNKLIEQQQNRTAAEIAENAKKLKEIFMPMMLSLTTFKYLIVGVVITLLGSAFLAKKK